MAAKKKPAAGDDAAAGKKSKKKLIIMVVVVLAIAGGAYKFVLAPKPKPGPAVAGDVVTMDPTTLNLADGHYLKIGVAVELVEGKATKDDFAPSHAQELVIDQFTGRTMAAMTNTTRTKLTHNLAASIKKAYPGEVYGIFVTQFVMQ